MPIEVAVTYVQDGRQHGVSRSVISVGRDADNVLVLGDTKASRHHLEFRASPPGVEVRDLGSTNGTILELPGGREVLRSGMRLVLPGGAPFRVVVGDTTLSVALAVEDAGAARTHPAPQPVPRAPMPVVPLGYPAPPFPAPVGYPGAQQINISVPREESIAFAVTTLVLWILGMVGLIIPPIAVVLELLAFILTVVGMFTGPRRGCFVAMAAVFIVLPIAVILLLLLIAGSVVAGLTNGFR